MCTGNICRSAYARAYLQRSLGPEWTVDSGGTSAYHSLAVPPELHAVAAEDGLDLHDHQAQPITERLFANADVVLSATVDHRSAVLSMWPRGLRRTFTFIEMAQLIQAEQGTEWNAMTVPERVRALSDHRGQTGATELDLADPYGGPIEAYIAMRAELIPALELISGVLAAPGPS
ncbi:low molecular weight phosphatase family protein [Calidifontibacter terrae]